MSNINNDYLTLKFFLLKKYEQRKINLLQKYNSNRSDSDKLSTFDSLEKKISNLFTIFSENNISNSNDYFCDERIIKDKIIDQYENIKENITIGLLTERNNKGYSVSLLIFDNDIVYNNLLYKEFSKENQASSYFNNLKELINNNDLTFISKYILELEKQG